MCVCVFVMCACVYACVCSCVFAMRALLVCVFVYAKRCVSPPTLARVWRTRCSRRSKRGAGSWSKGSAVRLTHWSSNSGVLVVEGTLVPR